MSQHTVVVTLTDHVYYHKARRTIIDIRTRGEWTGDLVLITVGFDAPTNFIDYYNVIPFRVEHIDTSMLLEKYKECPIRPTCDNREWGKLTQWDKFYVFHKWFAKWDKVLYVDAGLRVLDRIHYLANLECKGVIMAPDDAAPYDTQKRFGGIIEIDRNPHAVHELFKEYSPDIVNQRYFLNCIWMYDTALLQTVSFTDFVDTMNKYPICRCNEMTVMNLLFTFKYNVWQPFPEFVTIKKKVMSRFADVTDQRSDPEIIEFDESVNKRLFGWTEHDRDYGHHTTWRDFCFLKYPYTINFDCE